MKIKDSNTFKLKEVILIVLATALIVCFSTTLIISKRVGNISSTPKQPVNEISQSELDTFINAYKTILGNYYKDVDQKELVNTLISAMTNYLKDPYTSYLDKEATEELMTNLSGEFEGIGVRITKTDLGVMIIYVFKDSPAGKAGLLPGDIITKVNDIDTTRMETTQIINIIKETKNTKMTINVTRENETKIFELEVAKFDISVESEIIEKNGKKIGYIYISSFALNTYEKFKTELENLEANGIESLIIDVRTDSGGYLTSATDIIELFLKKGTVMYGVRTKEASENFLDETDEYREYKIVLLGNELSASASEILIGALKDSYGALLVGKTTYGKGKIQQTSALEDGSMLKYTTAEWLTPKGVCIDTTGITPDYEEEYSLDNDAQLNKAVELLAE